MFFDVLSEKEFLKIENNFKNSNFYQTTKWAKVKELTDWHAHYLGVRNQEKYLGAALLLSKKVLGPYQIFYSPRGFLGDFQNYDFVNFFTKQLKKYIKEKQGIFLKIDPLVTYLQRDKDGNIISNINQEVINDLTKVGYLHQGLSQNFQQDIQYRITFYQNILEENQMNKRCLRCLKKAEKYPLIMKDVTKDEIMDFKKIMEHTALRHNVHDRSLTYYLKMLEELKPNIFVKVIYLDKNKFLKEFLGHQLYEEVKKETRDLIPLSAGLFIKNLEVMTYVYGGTYAKYMPLMAQYKMQMEMITFAKKLNLKVYDFGGISDIFQKDSPFYGIYDFKRGFGGTIQEYIGEFDLVINKPLYKLYKMAYSLYKKRA